jgi:hypothetical protein
VLTSNPKAGEDPLAVAARERAGRVQANARIGKVADWYKALRAQYEAAK